MQKYDDNKNKSGMKIIFMIAQMMAMASLTIVLLYVCIAQITS